jgi:hypothetical protein
MRRASFTRIAALSLLLGCTDPTGRWSDGTPPIFDFAYPSSVVLEAFQAFPPSNPPGTLVGVRLTNVSTTAVTVEHGACSVAVWLYRESSTSSRPVWENTLPANAACIAVAYVQTIAPGGSYDVGGAILGAQTLGDSLPAGRYVVRVAVEHREAGSGSSSRLVVLDAGTVDLVR